MKLFDTPLRLALLADLNGQWEAEVRDGSGAVVALLYGTEDLATARAVYLVNAVNLHVPAFHVLPAEHDEDEAAYDRARTQANEEANDAG